MTLAAGGRGVQPATIAVRADTGLEGATGRRTNRVAGRTLSFFLPRGRVVYILELDGDTIACSSVPCVRSLQRQGWKLLDSVQPLEPGRSQPVNDEGHGFPLWPPARRGPARC